MTDRNESRPRSADKTVRDIRRATRRKFSAEEKIRIVLEGLRGEEAIAGTMTLVARLPGAKYVLVEDRWKTGGRWNFPGNQYSSVSH